MWGQGKTNIFRNSFRYFTENRFVRGKMCVREAYLLEAFKILGLKSRERIPVDLLA
jgi:hypothetical protein